jgi:hypothetical protein
VITLSQFLFFTLYSINKEYIWLQAHRFYNFSLMFVTTLFDFLVCGFHCCCYLSNFILDLLLAWIIFPWFTIYFLSPNPSNFTLVFNPIIAYSNMFEFLHYYSYALCNMVTIHAIGHSNLTIMVDDLRTTIVSEHCLCALFIFNHVLYIYLKMSQMIIITLSWVFYIRFLWPHHKQYIGCLLIKTKLSRENGLCRFIVNWIHRRLIWNEFQ